MHGKEANKGLVFNIGKAYRKPSVSQRLQHKFNPSPTFVKSKTHQHAHLWTREYVNVCAKESHFVCKLKLRLQRGIAILPQGNNHPSVSVKGKNVKIVSDQDY